MKLKDLIGMHVLKSVEIGCKKIQSEYDDELQYDASYIAFCLDDKVYFCYEDEDDGCRSSCRKLITKGGNTLGNAIPDTKVFCTMMENSDWHENNVLNIYDINTGKIVLKVGTKDTNDYYPCFVSQWMPENLHVNKDAEV